MDSTTEMDVEDTVDNQTESQSGDAVDKKKAAAQIIDEVRENCRLIERSVATKEPSFMLRVMRSLHSLRKRLTTPMLKRIVSSFYSNNCAIRDELLAFLPFKSDAEPMDVDNTSPVKSSSASKQATSKATVPELIPEVDCYLHLLILLHLMDICWSDNAGSESKLNVANCVQLLMNKVLSEKCCRRRTIDLITSRIFFYYARCVELDCILMPKCRAVAHLRAFLHSQLRSSCLRSDTESQAVLINCLLRSYLMDNLIGQADKLITKTTFPDGASNNEWARHLYYLGRIKAVQLEYSESHKHLVQALRKAPQTSALGFRHAVLKLSVTVQLLLGDTPARQTFLLDANKSALDPYLQLTRAVRAGDMVKFEAVLAHFAPSFRSDATYTLILRLRNNVIKTAIRQISISYSRISLTVVAQKLNLESAEEAEYVVAKAIRDGVIEAVIDEESGCIVSKDTSEVYNTREPQLAFHERIKFCLDLHNAAVRAMRYPPKGVWGDKSANGEDEDDVEKRKEREAQDLELARALAEEFDEEDDGGHDLL